MSLNIFNSNSFILESTAYAQGSNLTLPIIFHPHFSDGVQDLSCAALVQDKSCIPVE